MNVPNLFYKNSTVSFQRLRIFEKIKNKTSSIHFLDVVINTDGLFTFISIHACEKRSWLIQGTAVCSEHLLSCGPGV